MLKKTGRLFLLLAFLSSLFGQVSVRAKVDRNQIELGDNIVYTIEVSGLRDFNFKLPRIPNFNLLNPNPSTSHSMNITNGKMTQTVAYSYYLKPVKVGRLVIPNMTAKIKGKSYQIKAIVINVTKGAPQAKGADVLLKTVLSTSSPYVNQEITVRTILYVRNGISLKQVNLSKVPSISGVWKESYDLKNIQTLEPKTINNVAYNVYLLTKEALFPTKSGKLTIESAEMVASVVKPKKRKSRRRRSIFDDPFDNFFNRGGSVENVKVSAPKRILTVKNYPKENTSGFVGSLRIRSKFDKTAYKTNDGVKLTLTLSGTGNIQTLKVPKFYISPDIEQYEPSVRTSVDRSGNKISGRKTIEYVLVPRVAGEQKIGPIEYSYFNTAKKKLETIKIDEFVLDVKEGKSFNAVASGGVAGSSKKRLKEIGADIRYIKIRSDDFQKVNTHLAKSIPYFLAYPLILLLFFILNIVMQKREELNSNLSLKRKKTAKSKASKQLKEAAKYYNEKNVNEFFPSVHRGLMQFVADQSGRDAAGFTSDELRSLLKQYSVNEALIQRLLDLSEKCDFYRYSNPSDPNAEMQRIMEEAENLLDELIKAFKK